MIRRAQRYYTIRLLRRHTPPRRTPRMPSDTRRRVRHVMCVDTKMRHAWRRCIRYMASRGRARRLAAKMHNGAPERHAAHAMMRCAADIIFVTPARAKGRPLSARQVGIQDISDDIEAQYTRIYVSRFRHAMLRRCAMLPSQRVAPIQRRALRHTRCRSRAAAEEEPPRGATPSCCAPLSLWQKYL